MTAPVDQSVIDILYIWTNFTGIWQTKMECFSRGQYQKKMQVSSS